ncbi:MAG: DNA polymerase [Verrucomicrobiota bacterium]
MDSEYKDTMRNLAMGEEVPRDRRDDLLDYCQQDVEVLAAVWDLFGSQVDIKFASLRGRYLKSLAQVEHSGIPADISLVERLRTHHEEIKNAAWTEARHRYPGAITESGTFSSIGWCEWCATNGILWPLLPTGAPALDEDSFKKMADRYAAVRTMAYARKMRGQTRGFAFPVGGDGRLRCMLSPFGSDTGRNQPSNSNFIFGASAWLRSIVQAPPGRVLAYIDYSSQEFALAAALSDDEAMMADYRSGDPYLAFARRAGAVPEEATKASHPSERAIYKVASLAIQYGMRETNLSLRNGMSLPAARRLINQHEESYPIYWKWRQMVADNVLCGGSYSTCYGWRRMARFHDTATSITNFPTQATGAEILRIAVISLTEAGHRVIAPVHDAVLIEMDEQGWREELLAIQSRMVKAAAMVAPQIEMRTDVELILPGQHFVDGRGAEMWELIAPIVGLNPKVKI